MSPKERKKYAAAVDKLLRSSDVRKMFREDALSVVGSLGIDLDDRGVKEIGRKLNLTDANGVAVPAIPLVVVAVVVLSQADDSPDFANRAPQDD